MMGPAPEVGTLRGDEPPARHPCPTHISARIEALVVDGKLRNALDAFDDATLPPSSRPSRVARLMNRLKEWAIGKDNPGEAWFPESVDVFESALIALHRARQLIGWSERPPFKTWDAILTMVSLLRDPEYSNRVLRHLPIVVELLEKLEIRTGVHHPSDHPIGNLVPVVLRDPSGNPALLHAVEEKVSKISADRSARTSMGRLGWSSWMTSSLTLLRGNRLAPHLSFDAIAKDLASPGLPRPLGHIERGLLPWGICSSEKASPEDRALAREVILGAVQASGAHDNKGLQELLVLGLGPITVHEFEAYHVSKGRPSWDSPTPSTIAWVFACDGAPSDSMGNALARGAPCEVSIDYLDAFLASPAFSRGQKISSLVKNFYLMIRESLPRPESGFSVVNTPSLRHSSGRRRSDDGPSPRASVDALDKTLRTLERISATGDEVQFAILELAFACPEVSKNKPFLEYARTLCTLLRKQQPESRGESERLGEFP